jgi:hypothetical protein
MARIKRTNADGSALVGYRPTPGEPESYLTVPNHDAFALLDYHEKQARKKKVRFIPEEVLALMSAQPPEERHAALQPLPQPEVPTFREWVGGKDVVGMGLAYRYITCGEPTRLTRVGQAQKWVNPHLGDKRINEITYEDLLDLVEQLTVCPACADRALKKGENLSPRRLSVANPAFDGECTTIDPETGDEVSTHYITIKREYVQDIIKRVRAYLQVPVKRHLFGMTENPALGVEVPMFEDPIDDEDLRQAYSARQLQRLAQASPLGLEVLPDVATALILRPSETAGLSRADISWPMTEGDLTWVALNRVYIADTGSKERLRTFGKTRGSLKVTLPLTPSAAARLRWHLDNYRSNPSPHRCAACRDQVGEWIQDTPNPHGGCDFADDAAVFVEPDGSRLRPTWYTRAVWPRILAAAGMTEEELGWRAKPRYFRSTGATMAIAAGIAIDVVVRLGRWSSREMLEKHYLRLNASMLGDAAEVLEGYFRTELGEDPGEDAPLERRVQAAKARIRILEESNADLAEEVRRLGGDPASVAIISVTLPGRRPSTAFADRELLTRLVSECSSRSEILRRLGVDQTAGNYRRLEVAAARYGLELPERHPLRSSSRQEEGGRQAEGDAA